ncbi:MAG: alkaline phosphatase family protein [bacterium]
MLKQSLRIIIQSGLLGGIFGVLKGLEFVLDNGMFIHHITSIMLLALYFSLAFFAIGLIFGIGFAIIILIIRLIRKKTHPAKSWFGPWFWSALAILIFISSLNYWSAVSEFRILLPPLSLGLLKTFIILQLITGIMLLIYAIKIRKIHSAQYLGYIISGILIFIIFISTALAIHKYQQSATQENSLASKPAAVASIGSKKNKVKIILFAWDGASWEVINPLLKQGKLPNLQYLIDRGAAGHIKSMHPTKSPVIWTSIVTGKTPIKTGIYEFFRITGIPGVPETLPVTSTTDLTPSIFRFITLMQRAGWCKLIPDQQTDRQVKAVWDIVGEQQRTVGIINMWDTYPAEPVNGFTVSYFEDVKEHGPLKVTYPEKIYSTISSYFVYDTIANAAYIIQFIPALSTNSKLQLLRTKQDIVIQEMLVNFAHRPDEFVAATGKLLYPQFNPDLFAIYFEGGDIVSHKTWKYTYPQEFWGVSPDRIALYKDIIPKYYEYLDSLLAFYIQQMDQNTILVVVSDHGFHAIPAWKEKVYGWLGGPYISADHYLAPDGIIIFAGKGVKPKTIIEQASIFDITPTLLWLYGLPVAEDMDGNVIQEGFDQNLFGPIQKIPTYEFSKRSRQITDRPVLTPEMEERLRSLGYIGK